MVNSRPQFLLYLLVDYEQIKKVIVLSMTDKFREMEEKRVLLETNRN